MIAHISSPCGNDMSKATKNSGTENGSPTADQIGIRRTIRCAQRSNHHQSSATLAQEGLLLQVSHRVLIREAYSHPSKPLSSNTINAFSGDHLTRLDLRGMILGPGIYSFSSSAQLTGILTLISSPSSNSSWFFKIGSASTTASGSSVLSQGTARAYNVYWQVGSSATFGAGTNFAGIVLAGASITMVTGSTSNGGLFALGGSVTPDTNEVHVAERLASSSKTLLTSSIAGGGEGAMAMAMAMPRALLRSRGHHLLRHQLLLLIQVALSLQLLDKGTRPLRRQE
ncbi:hypothetical protein BDZ45DRAFT_172002 [Acephala macrosclerotiorum]|nr:hypothetical protein BDZ45DRAFT_172002 [Acephala macrosclerotiorum]